MQIVMQIMNGIQMIAENFPGLKKMPQVGPAVVSTGITAALLVKRPMVIAKPGILDGKLPF